MGSPDYLDEDTHTLVHGLAIADASAAAGDPPTKAEYDALVAKFNALLAAVRSANIIALD